MYSLRMATPYIHPLTGKTIRYVPAQTTTGETVRIFTILSVDKVGEGKSGAYIQGMMRDHLDGQERGRVLTLSRIEA